MKSQRQPRFSIIIPSYNRPRQLADCLRALALLDYPHDRFQVIVVDDGSAIPLHPMLLPFSQQLNLTLLRQPNAGPSAARNAGARAAQGEYLAFTDDDCAPAPDWLQELAAAFAKDPECLIGGRTVNRLTDNLYSTTSQLIVDVVYRHNNTNPDHARFFASNNMAMSAKRFSELGGFDINFRTSEDRELCDRWLHHGGRMTYAEDALVYHAHAHSLYSFCRQHYTYGQGAYHYHQIRAQRGSGTLIESMNFHIKLSNWLLYPLTTVRWTKALPLVGSLVLWQFFNALGFAAEAFQPPREPR